MQIISLFKSPLKKSLVGIECRAGIILNAIIWDSLPVGYKGIIIKIFSFYIHTVRVEYLKDLCKKTQRILKMYQLIENNF